jgi:hypothetical protein
LKKHDDCFAALSLGECGFFEIKRRVVPKSSAILTSIMFMIAIPIAHLQKDTIQVERYPYASNPTSIRVPSKAKGTFMG